MEKKNDMKIDMVSRTEIINRLLDKINEGDKLTEEQLKLLKDLSK